MTCLRNVLLCTIFAAGFIGCSFFETEVVEEAPPKETAPAPTSKVSVEAGQARATMSDVEVLWRIPTDPVDGFIIYYGYDKGHMDRSVRIDRQELSPSEDNQYGDVYRYILRDVSAGRPVLIAIAAFRGEEISQPSDVFSVQPVLQ